jgi:tetratricopeptide (TPR) repeat protein
MAADPRHATAMDLLNQGRFAQAATAFRKALVTAPRDTHLLYGLGEALTGLGELEAAEAAYRALLAVAPDFLPAKLALGGVLVDAKRPADAQAVLDGALDDPGPPRLRAMVRTTHGLALRRQRKDQPALESYEAAARLDPQLPGLDVHRAEALQNLHRHDEALAMFQMALARDPADAQAHRHYNDLLYRLGRADYLASYDRAPRMPALLMDKAGLLMQGGRHQDAYEVYRDVLALAPGDKAAAVGAAGALMKMQRHDEAEAAFSDLMARHGGDAGVCARAAELHLLRGDPHAAKAACARGLAALPHDQDCLAALSVAFRMLGDARDEELSGYEQLVRVFDLAPPEGFSSMEDFNAELDRYLDRIHPETREHVGQSLRGGTQTPDHVFRAGHDLIDRLERRIAGIVQDYVASLPQDDAHPFTARRRRGLRYAGSWSSRLKDCGFHVNHIHPQGWISSCYYVAVPGAAADAQQRQGWIKFGEPGFDVTLADPIRRMAQPVPGRLVLFPSYMWHGTVPFHDTARRTTIAFDVVPRA